MRASLLASATTTTFLCARASSSCAHRLRGVFRSNQVRQHGSRAMDQVLAKIAIAALADGEQARFAAGRHLARRQSEPRRHVPSTPKGAGVADGGDQRGGVDRSDPGNRHQASHRLLHSAPSDNSLSKTAIRSSRARHSARRSSISSLMRGLSASIPSSSAKVESCSSSLRRPCGATIPRSSSNARKWLISAVRSDTSRSRARCSA